MNSSASMSESRHFRLDYIEQSVSTSLRKAFASSSFLVYKIKMEYGLGFKNGQQNNSSILLSTLANYQHINQVDII